MQRSPCCCWHNLVFMKFKKEKKCPQKMKLWYSMHTQSTQEQLWLINCGSALTLHFIETCMDSSFSILSGRMIWVWTGGLGHFGRVVVLLLVSKWRLNGNHFLLWHKNFTVWIQFFFYYSVPVFLSICTVLQVFNASANASLTHLFFP